MYKINQEVEESTCIEQLGISSFIFYLKESILVIIMYLIFEKRKFEG